MKKITLIIFCLVAMIQLQAQQATKMHTLVDMNGDIVFQKECHYLGGVSDGFVLYYDAASQVHLNWGIIDLKEKKISVPANRNYAQIQWVENGQAVVIHREGLDYNFKKIENPYEQEVSYPYVGMIDARTGKEILPFEFTMISFLQDDIRIAQKREEFCVYDKDANLLFCQKGTNPKYQNGLIRYDVVIGKSDWGGNEVAGALVNLKGEIIVPHTADFEIGFLNFKSGMQKVEQDKKYGYINENGELSVPCLYDYAYDFKGDIAMVQKGDKYGYINKNNEVVIPIQYAKSTEALHFTADFIKFKKDNLWGLMNAKGEIVLPAENKLISKFKNGLAKLTDAEGNVSIINDKAEVVMPFGQGMTLGDRNKGTFSYKMDRKYGLLNVSGDEILPPEYSRMKLYKDFWIVTKDGKKGLVDNNGKVILEPKYKFIFGQTTEQGDLSFVFVNDDNLQGIFYQGKILEAKYKKVGTAWGGFVNVEL